MGKGRKKKPDALKVIQGTFQPCRASWSAGRQDGSPMQAPANVTPEVLAYFELLRSRVDVLKLASATFTEMLVMAAMHMADIDIFNKALANDGYFIDTPTAHGTTMLRPHPAITARAAAMRHLQALLKEFGLSPSDIGRVGGKSGDDKQKQGFGAL